MLYHYETNEAIIYKDKDLNACTYDFNGFSNYSMCWYLRDVHNIHRITSLEELMATKPPKVSYYITSYWFGYSDRNGRIECIKQAIAITEAKLKRRLILQL